LTCIKQIEANANSSTKASYATITASSASIVVCHMGRRLMLSTKTLFVRIDFGHQQYDISKGSTQFVSMVLIALIDALNYFRQIKLIFFNTRCRIGL
jgi:hypothetical protein